jgi:mannitol operon repressor
MPEKRTSYKPDADTLARYPHLSEFFGFMHDLRFESHRGVVLLCCAYLDDLLRDILSAYFEGKHVADLLEGAHAPLGSFSARASAAHACALISAAEYREISTLRKIRNAFAHSRSASFDEQSIGDLCRNLKYRVPDTDGKAPAPSACFSSAAVALITGLTNRPSYVAQDKRQPIRWPR